MTLAHFMKPQKRILKGAYCSLANSGPLNPRRLFHCVKIAAPNSFVVGKSVRNCAVVRPSAKRESMIAPAALALEAKGTTYPGNGMTAVATRPKASQPFQGRTRV